MLDVCSMRYYEEGSRGPGACVATTKLLGEPLADEVCCELMCG